MSDENELRKLLRAINKDKQYVLPGDEIKPIEMIPTGVLSLDKALNGGWPMGRVTVLYGAKGSTKSTLSLIAIGQAQATGKTCLYIDSEKSYDPVWAAKMGVDNSKIFVVGTKSLTDILKACKDMLEAGVEMIVIDSISSIHPDKYLDENNNALGQQARATKELLTKIEHWNAGALVMVISQLTTKIEQNYVVGAPTGGRYMEHASSVTLRLSSSKSDLHYRETDNGKLMLESNFIGMDIHWVLEKSRISTPLQKGMYTFDVKSGIDKDAELLQTGILIGVIEKSAGWLAYKDIKENGATRFFAKLNEKGYKEELYDEVSKTDW